MDMLEQRYFAVEALINKLDFASIWPDFAPVRFALYNGGSAVIGGRPAPLPHGFFGNTCIEYEGAPLAIWNVEDDDCGGDDILLASCIVHEMFHGFQRACGESRFPNDVLGLDYPLDERSIELKLNECAHLARAVLAAQEDIQTAAFRDFIAVRRERIKEYGNSLCYEFLIETVEGSAEYCGLMALKAFSHAAYSTRLKQYAEHICDMKTCMDARRFAYYTGALVLLAAKGAGALPELTIRGSQWALFYSINELVSSDLPLPELASCGAASALAAHDKELAELFEGFLSSPVKRVKGGFSISGYDPMNMKKRGSMIYHRYFLRLTDNASGATLDISGPAITVCGDSPMAVTEYITLL